MASVHPLLYGCTRKVAKHEKSVIVQKILACINAFSNAFIIDGHKFRRFFVAFYSIGSWTRSFQSALKISGKLWSCPWRFVKTFRFFFMFFCTNFGTSSGYLGFTTIEIRQHFPCNGIDVSNSNTERFFLGHGSTCLSRFEILWWHSHWTHIYQWNEDHSRTLAMSLKSTQTSSHQFW